MSYIEAFLNRIHKHNICMHSCMMVYKKEVILEAYWEPVKKNELHRLYSATKSFVSIAIGVLYDRGLISLDDKIVKFFPGLLLGKEVHSYILDTSIRDLLRMATPYSQATYGDPDICGKNWLESYFISEPDHPSGTIYNYDSCGSYVLGAIVRRITGQYFYDFLRDDALKELELSEESRCLLGPDKEAWAGSGILLSMRDFMKVALLLLNKGNWNGKQLISEEYVTAATTKQIDNNTNGADNPWNCGYGYQFWILKDGAYCMRGLGSQLAVCLPHKDFVFVCNADTQGRRGGGSEEIFNFLWDEVINHLEDKSTKSDIFKELDLSCRQMKSIPISGKVQSSYAETVNHVTYQMYDNPMDIREITLHLQENFGELEYCNIRGKKKILFGIGSCLTDKFPETHFPGDILGEQAGRAFRSVNSGAWVEDQKFVIRCNIVDDYVGNLTITICFKGKELSLSMYKNAQFFLKDYSGYAGGIQREREC